MRESAIERHLHTVVVTKLKGECLKFTSPGRRHVTDRLVLLPYGRVYFIELKRPGAMPRPGQVRFHKRLNELECHWAVFDTKEQIDAWAFGQSSEAWREIL